MSAFESGVRCRDDQIVPMDNLVIGRVVNCRLDLSTRESDDLLHLFRGIVTQPPSDLCARHTAQANNIPFGKITTGLHNTDRKQAFPLLADGTLRSRIDYEPTSGLHRVANPTLAKGNTLS